MWKGMDIVRGLLGQIRMKLFLAAALLLLAAILGGVWYFSFYTKTPDYSIRMIQTAIEKHDLAQFQKYVDVDHLLDTSCDALMEGIIDSERPMSDEARVAMSGFTKMFKAPLVTSFKGAVNQYIVSGTWGGDASKEADQGIPIDSDVVLSKSGLKDTSFRKIDYIAVDKEAGTAVAAVRVFQQDAASEFVLEVQFVQAGNGVWRASEITNFHEFIVFVMKARQVQLQKYVEDTTAIMERHDQVADANDRKVTEILSSGSLGNRETRAALKLLMQEAVIPDWTERRTELEDVDVPAAAQTLQKVRLRICDLHIAYAEGYAAWMDDKQAVTIRNADTKLKAAKTLEHEAVILMAQIKSGINS